MKAYILPIALMLFMAVMVHVILGCSSDSGDAPVGGCTLVDDTTSVCGDTQYTFY